MRLKRLILQGYKTFATKTEFVFDEGITSIIGPNGSGKSNVADAVRWVLGEQSYSTLRAKRTEDMIFTGSRNRSRAGMAQVTLVLDNDDNWLPIDYTEVEIGRRAYRSGENEYILNGQKVRLKDITELLATSGLAERTYTIVGQGLVDQALSLRAEERRALFEEAAGISHYKMKRSQTLRRLDETQRNLERVGDILSEIGPRLSSLRRQASRAQNYEQVAADLRNLLRIWYGYKWEQVKEGIRFAREDVVTVETGWQESRQMLQNQQLKIDGQRRRIQQIQQQVAIAQGKREEIRDKLEKARREVAILRERQESITRQLSEIERERPLLDQQRLTAESELAKAVTELEAAQKNLEETQAQLEAFDSTAPLESVQIEADNLRKKKNLIRDTRYDLIQGLKQLRQTHRELEKQFNKRQNELARVEARVELLNQMRHKAAQVKPEANVIGQFAALVNIPRRYEKALEAALRTRLATFVVPGSEDIWKIVDGSDIKETLAVIALNQIKPSPTPSNVPDDPVIIGWADKLVEGGPDIWPLNKLLLGQVLVIKDTPQKAYQIANKLSGGSMVVTLDGFVAHAGGLVEQSGRDVQSSILAQEAEWRQANEELDKGQANLVGFDVDLNTQLVSIQKKQEQVDDLQNQDEQLRQQEQQINQQLYQERQQRQILIQGINSARTIVAGRQAVVDSRQSTLIQVDGRIANLSTRKDSLLKQQQQASLNDDKADVNRLTQQLDALELEQKPLQVGLNESLKILAQLEDETSDIQKQTYHHETRYTQVKIALSQKQTQMEGLQERIKADLGIVELSYDDDQTGPTPLPMIDIVEQLPSVSEIPADIEESIQHYRGQLQRMGAINPDAPIEYEDTQKRFDFLTQQVEDLNRTKDQLRQIIGELDELTSRAFVETVEKVNTVFGDTFTQLFGGGSARLALTDPEDLTNSGVDIIARLPNRREQGLALLSGGERSLTATALIFSLLKVSPTPFCIMDEVDAALDEANINRFRELLHDLSHNTQFIVITHNRGTVQVAQTLYGISMSSDSTSQAISIKPEEYVKQASLV